MRFDYCVVCGEKLIVHQHHFIPRSMGGSDEDTNMLSLCPTHHYWLHKMMYSNTNRKKVEKVEQTLSKEELQKVQKEGTNIFLEKLFFDQKSSKNLYFWPFLVEKMLKTKILGRKFFFCSESIQNGPKRILKRKSRF